MTDDERFAETEGGGPKDKDPCGHRPEPQPMDDHMPLRVSADVSVLTFGEPGLLNARQSDIFDAENLRPAGRRDEGVLIHHVRVRKSLTSPPRGR